MAEPKDQISYYPQTKSAARMLGEGTLELTDEGVRVQGRSGPAGWPLTFIIIGVAIAVGIVCSFYGSRLILNELGWDLTGRKVGAKAVVIGLVTGFLPEKVLADPDIRVLQFRRNAAEVEL